MLRNKTDRIGNASARPVYTTTSNVGSFRASLLLMYLYCCPSRSPAVEHLDRRLFPRNLRICKNIPEEHQRKHRRDESTDSNIDIEVNQVSLRLVTAIILSSFNILQGHTSLRAHLNLGYKRSQVMEKYIPIVLRLHSKLVCESL